MKNLPCGRLFFANDIHEIEEFEEALISLNMSGPKTMATVAVEPDLFRRDKAGNTMIDRILKNITNGPRMVGKARECRWLPITTDILMCRNSPGC